MFGSVEKDHDRLSRTPSYVTFEGLLHRLLWKNVKNGKTLVFDAADDPVTNPAELIMVGIVGRGGLALDPMGNHYSIDQMPRNKWTFELEKPSEPCFAADFDVAWTLFEDIQKGGAGNEKCDYLLSTKAQPVVRFGAPLFRRKVSQKEAQIVPEGDVGAKASAPNYYPTAFNWPVTYGLDPAFKDLLQKHVFTPMQVFSANGLYIDPEDWALKLPGSLVEVTFSLHHAFLDSTKTNAFNAHPIQVVIIKEPRGVNQLSPVRRGLTRPSIVQEKKDSANGRAAGTPSQAVLGSASQEAGTKRGIDSEGDETAASDGDVHVNKKKKGAAQVETGGDIPALENEAATTRAKGKKANVGSTVA